MYVYVYFRTGSVWFLTLYNSHASSELNTTNK